MDTRKRDRLARRLTILLISVSLLCGASPAIAGSEIRPDGTLSFFDPKGNIQASIVIEMAQTPDERIRGLMERRTIGDKEGMLFIYDAPDDRFFWMRNTYIPLDIIFVSDTLQVIHIARKTEPLTEKRHWSRGPAQYVVEVAAGFSERHGITEGTRITWRKHSN